MPDLVGEDLSNCNLFVRSLTSDKRKHREGINRAFYSKAARRILCHDIDDTKVLSYDPMLRNYRTIV